MSSPQPLPSIDIGGNLLDGMYQGVYHGKTKHSPDLDNVLARARLYGVMSVLVTAGTLSEAKEALKLVRTEEKKGGSNIDRVPVSSSSSIILPKFLYSTVGVHPTRCNELEDGGEDYLRELLSVAIEGSSTGHIVAIGECGLDYDRLKFCPKEVQKRWFERHFELANKTGLPMFLHNRNTAGDFVEMIRANRERFSEGVVHSFDGSSEELKELLELGMYIGVNGCSLKTEENLKVMSQIPLDRLMIETDAPWCEIRRSHAGFKYVKTKFDSVKKERYDPTSNVSLCVKGRIEPCHIQQVLEVIANHRKIDPSSLAQKCLENTIRVFFPSKTAAAAATERETYEYFTESSRRVINSYGCLFSSEENSPDSS
eukprot:jgi/Bigna1/57378/fgenesh1_pm.11_\